MISDCRPLATTEDDKTAICQALDNLIDECTLILGWCYSQDHVRTTKVQQRDLSRSALAKMQIYCPDNKNSLHIPEDKFVEKAGLASLPLKPTMIFETSSSAKLVYSTMAFVFLQFLIQFFLWNWNINEWFCYVVHILIFPFLSQFYPCFLCSILWKEGFPKPDSDAKNGSQYHIVRGMGLYLCMNLLGTHRVILGHFMSFCPNYFDGLL